MAAEAFVRQQEEAMSLMTEGIVEEYLERASPADWSGMVVSA